MITLFVCFLLMKYFSLQVPVFAFGSAGPDLIVTSSNSGLPGQEGLDRTAMDIQQFARGGDLVQAQDGGEEEEIEVDESEEGGVSSIVSSSEQQGGARPSRARQVITWEEGSSSGTSSSSPQRQNTAVSIEDDDDEMKMKITTFNYFRPEEPGVE